MTSKQRPANSTPFPRYWKDLCAALHRYPDIGDFDEFWAHERYLEHCSWYYAHYRNPIIRKYFYPEKLLCRDLRKLTKSGHLSQG